MKLLWVILFSSFLFTASGQEVAFTKSNHPHSIIEGFFTKIISLQIDEADGGEPGYAIIRSTMGSTGSSKTISTNDGTYYVSQSIGQSSVIGTFSNKGYSIVQGYQQPLFSVRIIGFASGNNLKADIFPNPASHSLNILFKNEITSEIFIVLLDANGRAVLKENFQAANQVKLSLNHISTGIYFLKINSGNKYFTSKIIKE